MDKTKLDAVKQNVEDQVSIGVDILATMLAGLEHEPATITSPTKGVIAIQRVRLSGAYQSAKCPCVDIIALCNKAGITTSEFAEAVKLLADENLLVLCSESWQRQHGVSVADIRLNVERKRKHLYCTYVGCSRLKTGNSGETSYKSAQDSRAQGFLSMVFGSE